jgi:hypothetical protein
MKAKLLTAAAGALMIVVLPTPASAAMLPVVGQTVDTADGLLVEARVAARRTTVVRGPRGGVAARRTAVVRGGGVGVRRAAVVGGWARPVHYRWRPGGAIAAGAAIGMVAAGTAIAFAGQPPAPGLCWYYTDPTQRQGFWDQCS